ncbi:MAG TPA: monovalent cation:proton antiporter-2 (CPA2) family protein [Caulobacteraceae bacterium]|jgi:monovalent cation:proton antiporter-2 (CPA2) family protein
MDGGFLQQALVYLAAAVIAAPLFTRLKLGSVLGYLVAGVLIGPHVLGLTGDPEDAMHFAEFGVVILLFIIGLEMRPALLWSMRRAIFGLGGTQVLAGGIVLAVAALALGLELRPAVALGFILALSSTAIVLQSLEERGLRQGAIGQASFSVLLLQDLAVIPMFALLPLLASMPGTAGEAGGSLLAGQPAWLQAVATLAAVGAVLLAGKFLTRPVFRFIAGGGLHEVFTAAALFIVVGVTALMQTVGLSPALGAFLAGVVLAESEYRREIEADIEPFRGLFLGLFFLTIGSGLDLPALLAQPLLMVGLAAGLMVLKGAVIFGVARTFGHPRRDAGAIAASLAQGGEFAFVLFAFALGAGVLDAETIGLFSVVVALSMAGTPLLMSAYERWARVDRSGGQERAPDVIDDNRPDAIVAGFGRFGQVVARILIANGFRTTVLESSAAQVELVRKFGRRVYYGDATRLDLLRAAGAEHARLLVVAIDDREKAADLVEIARQEFPNLKVVARAWDRRHAYQLYDKGAHAVERETFEGGLALASAALQNLGMGQRKAHRAVQIFRRHDKALFEQLAPLWNDEDRFVVASRESSRVMETLLRQDLLDLGAGLDEDAWEPELPLRAADPDAGETPRQAERSGAEPS